MQLLPTTISGLVLLELDSHTDDRGCFTEMYCHKRYRKFGIDVDFVQDNLSTSKQGVLRGLHYQFNYPQGKLVSVINGEVFDVAVDLRRDSKSFGKWFGTILSKENRRQMYIPPGFAHGFYTLSDTADFAYKCTFRYVPDDNYTVKWNDPTINVEWPLIQGNSPILSDKDANAFPLGAARY